MHKIGHIVACVTTCLTLSSNPSSAGSPSECNAALIISTYNRIDSSKSDWRMASFVDKDTYDKIKQSVGVSAIIYGIPVGADYNDFEENISNYKTSNTETFSQEQFQNVSWTGLGSNAADAYKECIRSNSHGLYIIPDKASDSDLSFRISYGVIGGSPNPLPVVWTGGAAKGAELPKNVSAGERIIVIDRPTKSSTLALNDNGNAGFSDSVTLTPLPNPIPADQKFANKCVITETQNPGPVTRTHSFSWTCDRLRAGTYQVSLSVVPSSARPVRLGWHADIAFVGDQTRDVTSLATSSGQVIDSSINAGIGTSFQSNNNIVSVQKSGLLPVITIYIENTFWHGDFSKQSDDPINFPRAVNISVIGK
jgi:hypothetical protein